ncbi:MAG: NAD(P)-dependent oxidoreductase [Gemmatimonadota bacterium]
MKRSSRRILTHLSLSMVGRVAEEVPGVELVEIPGSGPIPPEAQGEILLTTVLARNFEEAVKRGVRWVHTYGTGIERFPFDVIGDRLLTCSRGASAIPISEWVLATILAAAKRLPESWIHEAPEGWSRAELDGLYGRTLGLIGIGGIGLATARRALAFGMRVRALRRKPVPSPLPEVELASDLHDLLGSADHLVVAAPATGETRHLLDAEAFAHMKPGVHLVNIARGQIIDQDALREVLDSGRVSLASLDVCDPEPLPAGHWLYTHPRVRLSPHISWSMPGSSEYLLDPFIANLRRYLAGEPLIDPVDVEAGY